jgi:hypothetical protein
MTSSNSSENTQHSQAKTSKSSVCDGYETFSQITRLHFIGRAEKSGG